MNYRSKRMMDYETKKEIDKLKARVKELEARLAVSSMPDEASALLADLGMVPETGEDDKVTLEMMDEFIKDMGYQTRVFTETGSIVFTDMYKDYELILLDDSQIRLSLCNELDPDVDRNTLILITETRDLSVDIRFDWKKNLIEYSVHSVELTKDSFRHSIRFFINLLNESEERLNSCYANARYAKAKRIREVKYS